MHTEATCGSQRCGQGTYHADDISLDGPGGGGSDGQAPSAPGGLRSTGKSSTSVSPPGRSSSRV
ncbi:hypothetical protein ACWDRX_22655 [Streptomyces nigra]